MLENIEVLCHASIKFNKGKVIYFDPFKIEKEYKDADIIFITHEHYDHYSEEDIKKIIKENTKIVATKDLEDRIIKFGFKKENILIVEPNNTYEIGNIKITTIPSYNTNKQFHPKKNGWVGYVVELEGIRYYIAGDTDITEENQKVQCDVAFLPIGGTYTMNSKEAAKLANKIKPKIAVPIHYGSIVGTEEDANEFMTLLNSEIRGEKLMK